MPNSFGTVPNKNLSKQAVRLGPIEAENIFSDNDTPVTSRHLKESSEYIAMITEASEGLGMLVSIAQDRAQKAVSEQEEESAENDDLSNKIADLEEKLEASAEYDNLWQFVYDLGFDPGLVTRMTLGHRNDMRDLLEGKIPTEYTHNVY